MFTVSSNTPSHISFAYDQSLAILRLGRSILKKLYVYRDETHPHGAQNPSELSFDIKKVVE